MNKINTTITLLSALSIIACGGNKDAEDKDAMTKAQGIERVSKVDTLNLERSIFSKQITCNGKLRAVEKSNLNFRGSGAVSKINVSNGSRVTKGSLIALLDTHEAEIALGRAEQDLEMAYVDLIDNLIGQGYDIDTTKVPAEVLKITKMSSGYNSSVYSLEEAKRSLEDCYLYAPFSGVVANVETKRHESTVGSQFCTLIDNSYFDVEFNLLEAEISEATVGQNIRAVLFVDDSREYKGTITEVNPLVDDDGQIKIKARMKNSDGKLLEGMNMKLIIERDIPNMFVVPKDAVVSRDGYFVVFRLIDGAAVWTYVDIVMSNIDSHVITGNAVKETKISSGDVIITSGNLNLADGTKVEAR